MTRSGLRVLSLALLPALLLPVLLWAQAADPTPVGESVAGESGAETEAPPSPVKVTATASAGEVTVGETFTLTLAATGPEGTTYRFDQGASGEQVELSSPEPAPDAEPLPPGTHVYEMAVFALGEVEIPPIPVRYRLPDGTEGETETEPLVVEVGSLLPRDADEQKLADIRGPRPVGIGVSFWVALVVALFLGAALVVWLVRRRQTGGAPEAAGEPETPPDVEALRALDALAASGLLEARAFREFYIRLTTVAKRYLERRLGAPVLEMTTSETLTFLRGNAHGGDLLPVFRDLAGAADQIKFARGPGLAEAAERHLSAVRGLVPALEARLRPVEPEDPREGKAA